MQSESLWRRHPRHGLVDVTLNRAPVMTTDLRNAKPEIDDVLKQVVRPLRNVLPAGSFGEREKAALELGNQAVWRRTSKNAGRRSCRARACLRGGTVKRGVFRWAPAAGFAIGTPRNPANASTQRESTGPPCSNGPTISTFCRVLAVGDSSRLSLLPMLGVSKHCWSSSGCLPNRRTSRGRVHRIGIERCRERAVVAGLWSTGLRAAKVRFGIDHEIRKYYSDGRSVRS